MKFHSTNFIGAVAFNHALDKCLPSNVDHKEYIEKRNEKVKEYLTMNSSMHHAKEVILVPERALDYVCSILNLKNTTRRNEEMVRARWITSVILRTQHKMGLSAIGKVLSRNHATILHGFKQMDEFQRRNYHQLENDWNKVKRTLYINWKFNYQ